MKRTETTFYLIKHIIRRFSEGKQLPLGAGWRIADVKAPQCAGYEWRRCKRTATC